MDDQHIVKLYFDRDEQAIAETQKTYGKYCHAIALRILENREDTEECVNDTYLQAWNSIPPERPTKLGAYLAKITRNLAINRYHADRCEKRGGGEVAIAMDELAECLADADSHASPADDIALRDALNRFLRQLPEATRDIFLMRYWYVCAIQDIARELGMTESRVKMQLSRTRERLRYFLEQEGIQV